MFDSRGADVLEQCRDRPLIDAGVGFYINPSFRAGSRALANPGGQLSRVGPIVAEENLAVAENRDQHCVVPVGASQLPTDHDYAARPANIRLINRRKNYLDRYQLYLRKQTTMNPTSTPTTRDR